jgi:4-hydroxybenzoate polyprenyltransferase
MSQQVVAIQKKPICVDLDGTLIKSDWLHEAIIALIASNPLMIFMVFIWAVRGPLKLKLELEKRVEIDPTSLPYNYEVINYLKDRKKNGYRILLVSATPENVLRCISEYLNLFDQVLGTDSNRNLKGKIKADTLTELFGEFGFEYIGNSNVDLHIWKKSALAHVVGSLSLKAKVNSKVALGQHWNNKTFSLFTFFKAIRIHQWVKNLLIFIPILMAHKINDNGSIINAVIAFFSFSLTASAVYLMNDLSDIRSDRLNKYKSNRPIASGDMSILFAGMLIPIFLALSFVISMNLTSNFFNILVLYFLTTTIYTFWLKKIVLLDIFTLASLYTIRIIAGGAATSVLVSPWLLAFSMFIFLSLACSKRATELHDMKKISDIKIPGRGYVGQDYAQIVQFGTISGYLAVLVLALYISNPQVTKLYSHPEWLWALCPFILYWISRIWLLTSRGQLHEDPIIFAISDKISYFVMISCLLALWFSI